MGWKRINWKSTLAGHVEIPGRTDPVVFRYPGMDAGVTFLALSTLFMGFAGMVLHQGLRLIPCLVAAPFLLVAALLVLMGCRHIFVHRQIEVHPAARRLVVLHRGPFWSRKEVVDFDRIHHIFIGGRKSNETLQIGDAVLVVLEDGSEVDFGLYKGYTGLVTAERLRDLTGAPFET